MFERANKGEFDLLYFHHPEIALPLARLYPRVKVAYTMHDPFYPWYRELFDLYKTPNQHYISISDNQRRDAPDISFASTVYNGIDPELFSFHKESEDYLIIAGRVVPDKGFKEAIQIARATNHRLYMIGPVPRDHQGYFDQYIKPELDENILYLGYMEQAQLASYYQKAKAYLMPIQWEEPFGLVMTESMSCGTPVIGLDRGSVSEVIEDGKTGFVCQNIEEMVEAVGKIDSIDRSYCRKYVEKNFAVKNMIDGYENAFKEIIVGSKPKRRHTGKAVLKRVSKVVPRKITTK
jgi:glycosyltransferase involved in cell wall biosynthesis